MRPKHLSLMAMSRPTTTVAENVHGRETRQQTSEHRSAPQACRKPTCTAVMLQLSRQAGRELCLVSPSVAASEEQLRGAITVLHAEYRSTSHTTGEDPRSRSTATGPPLGGQGTGQPHDPARLIHSGAHGKALKEQLHRSLSVRIPVHRGTSTSRPTLHTMG